MYRVLSIFETLQRFCTMFDPRVEFRNAKCKILLLFMRLSKNKI